MTQYSVTFSAALHVEVDAQDEEAARDKATEIANIKAAHEESLPRDIVVLTIHTDDIVRVEPSDD